MEFKTEKIGNDSELLKFLYETVPGRMLLKPLTSRTVSKLAGAFLDSKMSKLLIKDFVKKNGFTSDEYVLDGFKCFNDCFARNLRDGAREFDMSPDAFCSPCDGRLSVYKINSGLVLPVKQSKYTVCSLLRNPELAKKYKNGLCLVFRLCVDNYHRYSYIDSGEKSENKFIPGRLHTVRPIALKNGPIFTENCREYTVLHTENFGDVVQLEVGAMLVGKIKNHYGASKFAKGEEKGTFLYGGSTIILLIEDGKITLPEELFSATQRGEEAIVKMGERLGERSKFSDK